MGEREGQEPVAGNEADQSIAEQMSRMSKSERERTAMLLSAISRQQATFQESGRRDLVQDTNAILDLLPDAVMIYDHMGTIVYINSASRRMFAEWAGVLGMSYKERFTGVLFCDLQGKQLVKEQLPIHRLLHEKQCERLENIDVLLYFPGGKEMQVSVSGSRLHAQDGSVIGVLMLTRDMTERYEMERRLREAEELAREQAAQLEAILEAIPDALMVYDGQGNVVRTNVAVQELLKRFQEQNYLANPLEQRGTTIVAYNEQGEKLSREQWPVMRILAGETFVLEKPLDIVLYDTGGKKVYLAMTASPLYNEQGNIEGAVALHRDITYRKQTEQILQIQLHKLRIQADLIELAHDAIFVRDPEGRIVSWNRGAEQLYGWRSDEVQRQFAHILLKTQFPCPLETIMNVLEQEGEWEGELTHTKRDNTQVVVESRWATVRGADGKLMALLEINRDITERLEAERLKEEVISLAAHELRSPLTVFTTYMQLLKRRYGKEGNISQEMQSILRGMEAAGQQMADMATNFLDAARLQAGHMPIARQRIDLLEVSRTVIARLQALSEIHQLVLRTELKRLMVSADFARIDQVLNNLIANAIKYSPQGGTVEVRVWKDLREGYGGEALVSIRDGGIGIPLEQQPHLFERFVRGENTSGIRGTGLGLYLCKMLIELHGGRIWFKSTEGQGATFFVALPLAIKDTL